MEGDIRIACCGASGTGKTTLATILAKDFNLEMNPVGSRSVASDMGFETPYDVDKFGKRDEFQRKLFEKKFEWESERKRFITDRTHIDNLIYTIMHNCLGVDLNYINNILAACNYYTHIIYFPVDSFIKIDKDDKNRVFDLNYHVVYDWFLKLILGKFYSQKGYLTLNSSFLSERVFITKDWISDFSER